MKPVSHIVRYPLGPMAASADEERRRRIGIALVVLVLALFAGQIVALALGLLEVSALIFVIFIVIWFALRAYQRRAGG